MSESSTIFCGNLSSRVSEELLYELFLQAGPLNTVKIPKDSNGEQRSYAFIEFKHECSVNYAIHLFQDTFLYGKELQLSLRKSKNQNGANDANPHFRRQTSLPNMHQQAARMFPRPFFPNMGVKNLNGPYSPMLMNQGFIPPIHPVMLNPFLQVSMPGEPRSGFFMEQPARNHHRHNSDRGNKYDQCHKEDTRERGATMDREHNEARRDRSERHHRRSHSDHHPQRSRSRSRSRSRDRHLRHGDRDYERRSSRYDRNDSDYRRDETRHRR